MIKTQFLPFDYFEAYSQALSANMLELMQAKVTKSEYSASDFEYYIQRSATYSSNIEGNSIDEDTYLKNKRFLIKSKPKEMAEIDDLVAAYNFAVTNELNETNFLATHKLLSKHILSLKSQRGKLRDQQVGIYSEGRLEYMAVEPQYVKAEFKKLFNDIKTLAQEKLSSEVVFYYAAMIHLLFEKIHPFMDGNGRAGRLLEKWFLCTHLGQTVWAIHSEKYYAQHRSTYYKTIHIGIDYYSLNMAQCLPFLLLLPQALDEK